MLKKKIWANFQRIVEDFTQNILGKKKFTLFSYNLPAGTFSSVLKYNFCKNFVLQIYFADIISVRSIYPVGPKHESGSESGSPTLPGTPGLRNTLACPVFETSPY
jgi:hypothetical protein